MAVKTGTNAQYVVFSGSPPQCSSWVGQCGLYILVMIIEKIIMTGLIQFSFWEDVSTVHVIAVQS